MNRNDIETRMQLTAGLLIQPASEAPAWLNVGDLAGHKRTLERAGVDVLKAEKGYQRKMRNFTAQVGYMFEFKLREQFNLNLPMLMAALNLSANVAQFAVTAPSGTATFNGVAPGRSYFITSSGVPRVLLNTVVVSVSAVNKTVDVDYSIDLTTGELYIIPGGGISNGDNVAVTYGVAAYSTGFDTYGVTAIGGITGGALTDAGQKIGLIKLLEFDQHAAGGVPRRMQNFTGQYWCEGDEDHDGKKPVESLMLKILAVDKPAIVMLK